MPPSEKTAYLSGGRRVARHFVRVLESGALFGVLAVRSNSYLFHPSRAGLSESVRHPDSHTCTRLRTVVLTIGDSLGQLLMLTFNMGAGDGSLNGTPGFSYFLNGAVISLLVRLPPSSPLPVSPPTRPPVVAVYVPSCEDVMLTEMRL